MTLSRRFISAALMIIMLFSGTATTYCWQNLDQRSLNENYAQKADRSVELLKREKLPDGTEVSLHGAVFYLFTADGRQLGGRYTSDAEGRISVRLPAGDYYFQEATPPVGYDFDKAADGSERTKYPFTVTGQETETITVTAYNIRLTGSLVVEKQVQNSDGSVPTEEQKKLEFAFTVTFSDGGTYPCTIDGGEPFSVESGGTIRLKHGQQAVFEDLPFGVSYTVTEEPAEGYIVSATNHTGSISGGEVRAVFVNTAAVHDTGAVIVTKQIQTPDGTELTEEQKNREFAFTVTFSDGGTYPCTIDGGEPFPVESGGTIRLKHGQQAVFEGLPEGVSYTVTEEPAEGFAPVVGSFSGTVVADNTVTLPFVNFPKSGSGESGTLRIEKEIAGEAPDTEQEFAFTVTFSDGGTYPCTIDGGGPFPVESGGTIRLKHGQQAVFEGLPEGVSWTVKETDPAGFIPEVSTQSGTAVRGQTLTAHFINHPPLSPALIRVTKHLAGEGGSTEQEFHFTIQINGQETDFTLRPGESKEFEVPAGAEYEVREEILPEYSVKIDNGLGTAVSGETVEVTVTNTPVRPPEVELPGEKTWDLKDFGTEVLPESILVRLKNGELVAAEEIVTPDAEGKWRYRFTVPKYDRDGKEIAYTVEEVPPEGFVPTYDGLNIRNTYIPPVLLPLPDIEKRVEGENFPDTQFTFVMTALDGAPMPEGCEQLQVVRLTGSGMASLGQIYFTKPGTYVYKIAEVPDGKDGWHYDASSYTLTVTVTQKDSTLTASAVLEKDGAAADSILFVNRYDPSSGTASDVTICGQKHWHHGSNPNLPESVTVYLYADGKLKEQKLVTAADDWRYCFTEPRLGPDGRPIRYTIGEKEVPNYRSEGMGYDLINTYVPPQTPVSPGDPDAPQTGDKTAVWFWLTVMLCSMVGLMTMFLLPHVHRCQGRFLKRPKYLKRRWPMR